MSDDNPEMEEVLIQPLENLLLHIGRGIAQSQVEMDKNSYATQVLIDTDEALSERGIVAPWYHFPEVKVDLKIELSIQSVSETRENNKVARRSHLFAAPMNAAYCNTFHRDVQGSSSIQMRIVSIPPPTKPERPGEV